MRYTNKLYRRLTLLVSLIVLFSVAGLALAVPDSQAAAPPPGSDPAWKGEYYTNAKLKGQPALVRSEAKLDLNWGNGAPAAGLPADNWSARWTRRVDFARGTYRFCATVDDGVRLRLDGRQPFLQEWHDGSGTYCADLQVSEGLHTIQVEYYEHLGQARLRLWWEQTTWKGEYFANPKLKGQPALMRYDAKLDFNWGNGAPAAGLPADRWSARWTRRIYFAAGTYRLCVTADDGVRVEMDDKQPFIRQWHDGSGTYCADVQVAEGLHKVRVEYYERYGQARLRFTKERLN
jgi:hypothetical protein